MKPSLISVLPFAAALILASCFKGEIGPAGPPGPAGEKGLDGRPGLDGRDGLSVKTPRLTGMFRVFLKGVEYPFTKTDVDSSQYLFLSDTWTFRLYKTVGDSCLQAKQGTVEWGGAVLVLSDSGNNAFSYITQGTNAGSYLQGEPSDTLLNCIRCDLRPGTACIANGK